MYQFHLKEYECWQFVILDVILNTGLGGLGWNHLDVAHLLQSLHNIWQVGLVNIILNKKCWNYSSLQTSNIVSSSMNVARTNLFALMCLLKSESFLMVFTAMMEHN